MKVVRLLLTLFISAVGAASLAQAQQAGPPASAQGSAGTSTGSMSAPVSGSLDEMGIQKYLLGPGDVLDLRVFNEPQFSDKLQVTDEGNVEVPFIGAIPARCRTDVEVRKDIVTALGKYLRSPQVSLRITEFKSRPPAVVFGAVRDPSRIEMKRRARLLDLIATAGGATEQAGGDIQIFHTEAEMCLSPDDTLAQKKSVDEILEGGFTVYKLSDLKLGKPDANPAIRPGDIIIVREAPPIYITGAVNQPQGLYLREKLQLTRAIAMVGGTRPGAKTNGIRIFRFKPNTQDQEIITVDYDAIKKQKKPDMLLQPYDVIEVPEASGFLPIAKKFLLGPGISQIGSSALSLPLRVLY